MIMTQYLRSMPEDTEQENDVTDIRKLWQISYAFGQNDCLVALQRVESDVRGQAEHYLAMIMDDGSITLAHARRHDAVFRLSRCRFAMRQALGDFRTCRQLIYLGCRMSGLEEHLKI